MNFYHVFHTGANNRYYHDVLEELDAQGKINLEMKRLNVFAEEGVPNGADVLSYQTFPDENVTAKFNPTLVYKADEIFKQFSGHKIISCSHDNGGVDSYSRFPNSKELPRIKCCPTRWFLDNYNVVLISSFNTKDKSIYHTDGGRNIVVSCKLKKKGKDKFYFHRIREQVLEYLKEFFPSKIYYEWAPGREAYLQEMRRTLIAIGAPGWGQRNATYQLALRCGTLLFAHCSFKDIVYLPHAELIDGEDFISYNLFDFPERLRRLLETPREEIDRIRRRGRHKYSYGYDVKKSARQFYAYLCTL